jgi:hypothetical protein
MDNTARTPSPEPSHDPFIPGPISAHPMPGYKQIDSNEIEDLLVAFEHTALSNLLEKHNKLNKYMDTVVRELSCWWVEPDDYFAHFAELWDDWHNIRLQEFMEENGLGKEFEAMTMHNRLYPSISFNN